MISSYPMGTRNSPTPIDWRPSSALGVFPQAPKYSRAQYKAPLSGLGWVNPGGESGGFSDGHVDEFAGALTIYLLVSSVVEPSAVVVVG